MHVYCDIFFFHKVLENYFEAKPESPSSKMNITQFWLQRNRPPDDIRQVVSSCPTCQLNIPQAACRPQVAQHIQWRGTYPGEDW